MRKLTLAILAFLFSYTINAQSKDSISIALDLIDLSFDGSELDSMKRDLQRQKESFQNIRKESLPNDLAYSMVFMPPINTAKIPKEQHFQIHYFCIKKIIFIH